MLFFLAGLFTTDDMDFEICVICERYVEKEQSGRRPTGNHRDTENALV
jgi:hypothetical protein